MAAPWNREGEKKFNKKEARRSPQCNIDWAPTRFIVDDKWLGSFELDWLTFLIFREAGNAIIKNRKTLSHNVHFPTLSIWPVSCYWKICGWDPNFSTFPCKGHRWAKLTVFLPLDEVEGLSEWESKEWMLPAGFAERPTNKLYVLHTGLFPFLVHSE